MKITDLAKEFFAILDERIGPFDRPIQFRPFPFDAGGALNFLTLGAGGEQYVTYVSWDLFGHAKQRRGSMGRYELVATCDEEEWCLDVLTKIGRQSLQTLFQPGDTLDIGPWIGTEAPLQGIAFEEEFRTRLKIGHEEEPCGLLRCIGITRAELEFARIHGLEAVMERLKQAGIYPRTSVWRKSVV